MQRKTTDNTAARYDYIVLCPKGFEGLLRDEIASCNGSQIRPLTGQVRCSGTLELGYKLCLWSRLASRVLLVLGHFDAADADELYQGVHSFSWESLICPNAEFAIDARGTNEKLINTLFIAQRAKDALVDRYFEHTGIRLNARPAQARLRFSLRLQKNKATLALDMSGQPLFYRGFESKSFGTAKESALRPDYAAAALLASEFFANGSQGASQPSLNKLSDLVLVGAHSAEIFTQEALGLYQGLAPGLEHQRWAFEYWQDHDQELWDSLVQKAQDHYKQRIAELTADGGKLRILLAGSHLKSAALKRKLRSLGRDYSCCDIEDVADTSSSEEKQASADRVLMCDSQKSLVLCNLAGYFEDQLSYLSHDLAGLLNYGELPLVLLVQEGFDAGLLGRREKHRIETSYKRRAALLLNLESNSQNHQKMISVRDTDLSLFMEQSEQFAARLKKQHKLLRKHAQRNGVSCYRVYDADLPDYKLAIDVFESLQQERFLRISEYAAPRHIDPIKAQLRVMDALRIAACELNVPLSQVLLRTRRRERGGAQYADIAEKGARRSQRLSSVEVDEGGLTFELNFADRLDCGIFLDHRLVRNFVREAMKNMKGSKRFLNLFAYTGTASCYAADGGAHYTTTVDLSSTYLDWAKRNMAANGFQGNDHEFVCADVMRWIRDQRRSPHRWDLIFCDVPTFSNSSKMGKKSFDVQRDHVELLISVSRLLMKDGLALFSCNLRDFKLDYESLEKYGVGIVDVSSDSIPFDFAGNPQVHHVFLLKRGTAEGLEGYQALLHELKQED